jgi:SAM-dependent methyltransferase
LPADLEQIRAHWTNWAQSFGTDLRATTRTSTAKELELDALERTVSDIRREHGRPISVLEAGCGNGHNCIRLASAFPDCRFVAFDYIPEMVAAARELAGEAGITEERLRIFEDDVLQLRNVVGNFDVVMTVRCLINLNTDELQTKAMTSLFGHVAAGGYLLMIENSRQTHGQQNRAREALGLPARLPAEFNRFLDEAIVLPHLRSLGLEVKTEDFGSLHDLVLYALIPAINGGTVDYAHPLVEAATRLSLSFNHEARNGFGSFGQNRLFLCRKAA